MPDPSRKQPKPKTTAGRQIPGAFEGETVTRRRFMVGSAGLAGAVAVSAIALPTIGFAVGPVFERQETNWEDVGKAGVPLDHPFKRDAQGNVVKGPEGKPVPASPSEIGSFPWATYVPVSATVEPDVGEVGKTTIYMRAWNPGIDGAPKPPDQYERYIALSTRCAHLGCPVRFVEAAERFVCPCHGGVYDFSGKVTGGPPVRPLDRFYTRVVDGRVQIGPRYSVNSELQRYTPRDPGEPLDGLGQYAYPPRFSVPKVPNSDTKTW